MLTSDTAATLTSESAKSRVVHDTEETKKKKNASDPTSASETEFCSSGSLQKKEEKAERVLPEIGGSSMPACMERDSCATSPCVLLFLVDIGKCGAGHMRFASGGVVVQAW